MRADSAAFAAYNQSAAKNPRFVIAHMFDVGSVYATSHGDIPSVPGIVLENVVREPSAISQRIVPDEGRSEIGSFNYSLVDLASAVTNALRDKLQTDDVSFRGKQVRFYSGYEGQDFTEFQLFTTQTLRDFDFQDGAYSVKCQDITRAQREEIFEPKKTTLRDTVSATDTTIPVYATTGFETVFHGPTYSDGPSSTVGYIQIEDEKIRYTGKTSDTFTGCTRGVLNTKAVAHTVDAGADAERRPKVQEVIYLELPAVKLAYALQTGVLHGDAATLPAHWHCGIDTALVRLSDFTGIGPDLWNPAADASAFIARFESPGKTNAKQFIEKELCQLLGCYQSVYCDGAVGIKRMNAVLADAAYVVELNESNCVEWTALEHDFSGMHNRLLIEWNWNGKEFTRSTLFVDGDSITIHGAAPLKKLQFKGLHGSRHTEAIIRKRLDAFRDRYSAPPERINVTVLPSLNYLEIGDIVRLRLPNVRDYAGNTSSIDRSFEIQNKSENSATGEVTLELFGSTAPASIESPNDTGGAALPDAFYTAVGTNLTTVCTIVVVGAVGVIQPGTYNLTGNADMGASGAVYYYNGDLELANGATLTVNANTQIRAKGFFTINGTIDGVGRGKAGVASSGGVTTLNPGTAGFLGNSRGMDGVRREVLPPRGAGQFRTVPAAFTQGLNSTFPLLEISVSGNTLIGIPSDMRGTSGGGGGKAIYSNSTNPTSGTVMAQGGTGAASGAGLCIVSRGLAFGASAAVNLSGNSSAATSAVSLNGNSGFPGAGAAGAPGAMLILLDGSSLTLPDVGGKFTAVTGNVPVNGNTLNDRGVARPIPPVGGYEDEAMISDVDLSNVAYRIQYIAGVETPQSDKDILPPAPTALSAVGGERIITLRVTPGGPLAANDKIEVYASIDNNRVNAVRVAWAAGTEFTEDVPAGGPRWHWTRVRRERNGPDLFSDWFPSGATSGILASAFDFAGELPGKNGVFLDTFEHQDYARFYNLRDGTPTITYPTDGKNGGRVIQFQNYGWVAWKQNMPFDPDATYLMTVVARMVTAPTGGVSTQDKFLAGVEGVAADGTTLINTSGANSFGNQYFFAASNFDFGGVTLGDWVTFRGYLAGLGTPDGLAHDDITDPEVAYESGGTVVKFIRPLIIANYNGGNGVMQVDYVRIDKIVNTEGIAPNAATEVYSTSVAGPVGPSGLTGDVARVSIPGYPSPHTVIVTGVGDFWKNNASFHQIFALFAPVSGTSGTAGNLTPIRSTASPGDRLTIRHEFEVFGGELNTPHDLVLFHESAVIGSQAFWQNVRWQAEVIKR